MGNMLFYVCHTVLITGAILSFSASGYALAKKQKWFGWMR